jgi:hypothetical protein
MGCDDLNGNWGAAAAPVGRHGHSSRYCCASKHIQLMTAGMYFVNQSDTPREYQPLGGGGLRHLLHTARWGSAGLNEVDP